MQLSTGPVSSNVEKWSGEPNGSSEPSRLQVLAQILVRPLSSLDAQDTMGNAFTTYVRMTRARAAEGHKGVIRQALEMSLLMIVRRIGPGHYFVAQMYERTRDLPYVLGWMNEHTYQHMCRKHNDEKYEIVARDKRLDKALLSAYGIPTPQYLGYFHSTNGTTRNGKALNSPEDFVSLLLPDKGVKGIVLKPATGFGGSGVHLIDTEEYRQVGSSETEGISESGLARIAERIKEIARTTQDGWIVEEMASQHADMASLNPTSLNTIRVIVAEDGSSASRIVLTMLRVGRAGARVDNTSKGGLAGRIDPLTGVVTSVRLGDFETVRTHPDSGVELVGVQIPFWPEVIALAKKVLKVYPGLRLIGCDIGIGPEGPFMVETNHMPDKIHFAYTNQPSRKALLFR